MLQISNLSKTYPNGVQALKGVDLTIDRGLFGLLGPNGAGKSTLMRTLATLQEPDTGEIVFDGLDVVRDPEVRGRPGFISVDPFERRIEVERADNVRELSAASAPR